MMLVAIDTETTGVNFTHGCRPFAIALSILYTEDGSLEDFYYRLLHDDSPLEEGCTTSNFYVEFSVDPKTRIPEIDRKKLTAIKYSIDYADLCIFHHAKFDVRALETIQLVNGLKFLQHTPFADTMVAAHVLDSAGSHKLKDLAKRHIGISTQDQEELHQAVNRARTVGKSLGWRIANPHDPHFPAQRRAPSSGWWVMDMWLPAAIYNYDENLAEPDWKDLCKTYCSLDADRTLLLWLKMYPYLMQGSASWTPYGRESVTTSYWDTYNKRLDKLHATYQMETVGITFSQKSLEDMDKKFTGEATRKAAVAKKLLGIKNLNSGKQIAEALHDTHGIPIKYRAKKGSPSTSAEDLKKYLLDLPPTSPVAKGIECLLRYRKLDKGSEFLETYKLSGLKISQKELPARYRTDVEDYRRLHSNINDIGTATTRASSNNPNMQQVSKQSAINCRRIFCPLPGKVWYALDYDNIEMRLFAYSAGDQNLIGAFESGYSVHLIFAEILWPVEFKKHPDEKFKDKYADTLYQWTKNGDFSLIYGAFPPTANAAYHNPEGFELIRQRLPLVDEFISKMMAIGKRTGQVITLGGYPLQVDNSSRFRLRSTSCNYFIQGSAGIAMDSAIVRCHEYLESLGQAFRMLLTVHDELVFELPAEDENSEIKSRKKNAAPLYKEPSHEEIVQELANLMQMSGEDIGIPLPVSGKKITDNWGSGENIHLLPLAPF